jgi:hypothetical protein
MPEALRLDPLAEDVVAPALARARLQAPRGHDAPSERGV